LDEAGSANGLCPIAFEKSYLTLVAPKKPKRFCGAFIKSDPPEARIPSHPPAKPQFVAQTLGSLEPSIFIAACAASG
jgi:hypothetical protein